jgi:hypothetical protein
VNIAKIVEIDPKIIVAFFSPILTYALNRFFSPSAKLYHSARHKFTYLINEPRLNPDGSVASTTQTAKIASFSVSNVGRAAAKGVEIVFNWKPAYINFWPLRAYQETVHPDGRYSIHLETLSPKEVFGIELLAINVELPEMVNVRSEQIISKEKILLPQIVSPKWLMSILWTLLTLGLMAAVYLVLSIIEFSVRQSLISKLNQ